jgi:Leucine-rich repeat (LRR) protein
MPGKRRFFRVSLRALLVLVTAFCVWLGKLSIDARRQHEAVEWVLEHGGQVTYDWETKAPRPKGRPRKSPARWLAWTRRVFSEHLFQTVTTARVTHMRGVDMAPVARLRDVEELDLTSCGMSDLRPLAKLRRLKRLVLVDNDITDLSPLAGLTELVKLDLSYNEISDLSPLAGLAQLNSINLEHNRIEDVAVLAKLPNLREIDLDRNLLPNWQPYTFSPQGSFR